MPRLDIAVDDPAALHFDEKCRVAHHFEQVAVFVFRGAHGLFGRAAATALLRLAQLPLHGGTKPREVVLHYVVVGAGFHGIHGHILAYGAGNVDEWQVEAGLLENPQRLAAAKSREAEIGEDHVPFLPRQRAAESLGSLHPLACDVVSAMAQLLEQQTRVVLVVFGRSTRMGMLICGLRRQVEPR